ncbi:response regulator transcription factor [Paenibacillus sp. FSL H7-0331]|uniref:response regulator transcription factor n=2 Tax=Paenibacillus sp. FSL H7-0331 TaxID=1920421 RepID=UPI00096DD5A5|nr:response regulator transcription factor [Paenibacillus sp. FSL H7-0331]OMF06053.1 DNA-binding response regulator [Paenibacillus sp. FSL H7-0331]
MGYRVMIIEDDDKIADILSDYIRRYGYEALRAFDFSKIKEQFIEQQPDLVLLDINLPRFDGFYSCRQIRLISNVPVLFISARTGEMDQVMAIENGGDDYIAKPFHLEVVLAKIKSALRRAYGEYSIPAESRDLLELQGLTLDRTRNTLSWQGYQVELTHKECLLYDTLARKIGNIVSREQLLEAIWDDIHFVDDNSLTVNVTRLRKKLEQLGIEKAVQTVRGSGYRLNPSWKGGLSK